MYRYTIQYHFIHTPHNAPCPIQYTNPNNTHANHSKSHFHTTNLCQPPSTPHSPPSTSLYHKPIPHSPHSTSHPHPTQCPNVPSNTQPPTIPMPTTTRNTKVNHHPMPAHLPHPIAIPQTHRYPTVHIPHLITPHTHPTPHTIVKYCRESSSLTFKLPRKNRGNIMEKAWNKSWNNHGTVMENHEKIMPMPQTPSPSPPHSTPHANTTHLPWPPTPHPMPTPHTSHPCPTWNHTPHPPHCGVSVYFNPYI